jgi:hypothetical protein
MIIEVESSKKISENKNDGQYWQSKLDDFFRLKFVFHPDFIPFDFRG